MAKMNCNFISYTLKRAVDITVVIPSVTIPESLGMGLGNEQKPSHQIKDKYPVLYLLHGYGNNHATWNGYSNIELYAEERQMAVVMISAENKFYSNVAEEDHYYDFVSQELPEFIQSMFPVSSRVEDTYIAGLSMGGYGALLHGLTHPERYQAIGSFSGAVSVQRDDEQINLSDHIQKMIDDKAIFPQLYIACGKEDFIYQSNVDLVEKLKANDIPVTVDFVDSYTHEWRFWDLEVERFLDWIDRTDAYCNKKRNV